MADIIFIVPSKDGLYRERMFAHRFVLRLNSVVFETMLSPIPQRHVEEIELPDTSSEGISVMLKYMYTGQVKLSLDNVHSTMNLAQKYFIEGLARECVEFMKRNLQTENVIKILRDADAFNESDLSEACLNIIDKHCSCLFKREEFANLNRDLVKTILQRNTLECRENEVYNAVLKWIEKHEEKTSDWAGEVIREKYADVIDLIRFPLLSTVELATGPCRKELLTMQEAYQILMFMFAQAEPPKRFSHEARGQHKSQRG